ncbi:MAG TPA: hypothetical protein VFL63_11365 [Rhodanobacteraceae bacterium]|nr:hypothetical protein [Rhodanobacteraceae bacterium]
MKANERAQWVEHLLKQEFGGRGWSAWMLTHPAPAVPAPPDAQEKRAKSGIDAEIAVRRMRLEALSENDLELAYLQARVRELEANTELGSAKVKKLEDENTDLRARACKLEADAAAGSTAAKKLADEYAALRGAFDDLNDDANPDPRVKTSLLKIVGALVNECNRLVDDYNATEGPSNNPALRKRTLDTADLKTMVRAICGMAGGMPDPRTVKKLVKLAISMTDPQRPPAKPAKP